VIVGHDWGGALGMHYAARNPGKVKGIALVETFLRPMTWADFPPQGAELFRAIRTAKGEEMVLAAGDPDRRRPRGRRANHY